MRGPAAWSWLRARARGRGKYVAAYAGCALAAAVIAAPLAVERAVERARFSDDLGTLPVEVTLVHNGRSTLDTGVLGQIYWAQTGRWGFGAKARVTGPPQAGGTLASYVDKRFISANAALIDDPAVVVHAYSEKFADALLDRLLRDELLAALIGGAVLVAVVPWRRLREHPVSHAGLAATVLVVAGTAASAGIAVVLFHQWPGAQPVTDDHPLPGNPRLSFSSTEALEVAEQVKPFIDEQTERADHRAAAYEARTRATFRSALASVGTRLAPRENETIVVAEADPQGSFVGIHVRTALYEELVKAIGEDSISLRTMSGDITSNGTVAESGFVEDEAKVLEGVPVAAAAGDHDSVTTWQQLEDAGIELPDLSTVELEGLRVSAANDREHKTLFGGMVTNPSGVSEQELGAKLRAEVDEESRIVLLHQPDAAAGYLGLEDLGPVRDLDGELTMPREDGIPDQVPGIVSVGHLHEPDGPWVIWNTDGDEVTWTVVDQLGTAGGVENAPTFNRFSTPTSMPLKPLSVRLQYVDTRSGLETGFATIVCRVDGRCSISDRTDVGLPGGLPGKPAAP